MVALGGVCVWCLPVFLRKAVAVAIHVLPVGPDSCRRREPAGMAPASSLGVYLVPGTSGWQRVRVPHLLALPWVQWITVGHGHEVVRCVYLRDAGLVIVIGDVDDLWV